MDDGSIWLYSQLSIDIQRNLAAIPGVNISVFKDFAYGVGNGITKAGAQNDIVITWKILPEGTTRRYTMLW